MTEAALTRRIMKALSGAGVRIFRNNVGVLKDENGQRIRYGLCNGSSDLIGWTPVTIRPEHVGRTMAVFTAIEVKTPKGRPTQAQTAFIDAVSRGGGIAAVARSDAEALAIIASPLK